MDEKELRDRIGGFYKIICGNRLGDDFNSTQKKTRVIQELEKLLKTDFKNTEDFHFKIKSYLKTGQAVSPGKQLQRARKKMEMSQIRISLELECSRDVVAKMENGKRPLSKNALLLIELTNYPNFNKSLILKQLQEYRTKSTLDHEEPPFSHKNVVDSKQVARAKKAVRDNDN